MPNTTPFVLVFFLALSSAILSFRTPAPQSQSPAIPTPQAAAPAALIENSATTQTPVSAPETTTASTPPPPTPPTPWPQGSSDILPDPSATFGTLPNGMRYVILPNAEPPGRLSMRLHVAAGSLMETEDQRGIAHFLEHMVFNGTKHYTAEDLIPKMQRLGIAFGADANAYTSFDETVYKFDMLDLTPETLQLAFTVLRDFADGALLQPEQIEKERGVILSEKISRDTVSNRIMEQQFAHLLPNSRISHRFPIGIEPVIKSAPREQFVNFYNGFYTPQRMTFVVVGDITPDEMQSQITKTFGSMTNPANPAANPDMGSIRQPEGIETAIFADKELAGTDVSLMRARPHQPKSDTSARRAELLPLDLANAALSRRFERIAKEPNSPVTAGEASNSVIFRIVELGSISITASNDRWKDAIPVLEQEFRRAMDHGFTESEISEAKANLLNAYEQQVRQKSTRKSEALATAIARSINEGMVFSTPESDLEITRASLSQIDPTVCHRAFQSFWEAPGHDLILTTKEKPKNAEKEMAAIFQESRSKAVEPPAARAVQVFGYQSFGKTHSPSSSKSIDDLGITQLSYPNQIRVNLKHTDFEKGRIRLVARFGSGKCGQPKDSPMLDFFAQAIFDGGGLGLHSNDDLRQILAGRNVSSSLVIEEDAFLLAGSTTPPDFELQCQLMCAALTNPGYREEALSQFRKSIPTLEQQLRHTPAGPQAEMEAWLHGGDPRYSIADSSQINTYTIDHARNWLTPELTKGYLELSIVGDFSPAEIQPILDATFGSLPARAATPPALATARKVKFPNAPANKTFTYQSKIPQAMAVTIWQTDGLRSNQKEFRRLNLLAQILGDRLREEIREKLGASYGPDAGADGSDALESFSYLIGQSVGKPEDLKVLLETMRSQADELANQGATADELDRALKPTLGQLEKSRRDNKYWLNTVLSQAQSDPNRLTLARSRDADYRSISLTEINALARKYLRAERTLFISIKPEDAK